MKIERLTVTSNEPFGAVGVTIVLEENENPDKAFEEAQTFIGAKIRLMGDRHDEIGEARRLREHQMELERRYRAMEELKRAQRNPYAAITFPPYPISSPPSPPASSELVDDIKDMMDRIKKYGIQGIAKK